MAKIAIIGSGFSSLSAAAYLSKAGHEVQVFEKNESAGGRARKFKTEQGFVFDMGPSWYWMPEVYEKFFEDFGTSTAGQYDLVRLDPSFRLVLGKNQYIDIPDNFEKLCLLFESIEKGSGDQLKQFMLSAEKKYKISFDQFIYNPGLSITEFFNLEIVKAAFSLDLLSSFKTYIRRFFSNPVLLAIMEFPILFLGAMPKDTPAMYSLMNYAGLKLGNFYPIGGFSKIVTAIQEICEHQGVKFHFNSPVQKIIVENKSVQGILVNDDIQRFDAIVAGADYAHVDSELLPNEYSNYTKEYWTKKTFAPSCLIFYLGINKKLDNITHHTLFFDHELDQHAQQIYVNKKWPDKPLFYLSCPSVTDKTVAPPGHENLFILIPIATGLDDSITIRKTYLDIVLDRIESTFDIHIKENIVFERSYCVQDFKNDYNAYGGNAYGLANTIGQTANLKPSIKNKKLKGLYYTGQLTVPGPGVPPAIISGKIVATELMKNIKK